MFLVDENGCEFGDDGPPREWEARCFSISEDGGPPWLVCVTCCCDDLFLAQAVLHTKPTPADLWRIFEDPLACAAKEQIPPRPVVLKVHAGDAWTELKDRLVQIGIELQTTNAFLYPDGFPEWVACEWQKMGRIASSWRLNCAVRRRLPSAPVSPPCSSPCAASAAFGVRPAVEHFLRLRDPSIQRRLFGRVRDLNEPSSHKDTLHRLFPSFAFHMPSPFKT